MQNRVCITMFAESIRGISGISIFRVRGRGGPPELGKGPFRLGGKLENKKADPWHLGTSVDNSKADGEMMRFVLATTLALAAGQGGRRDAVAPTIVGGQLSVPNSIPFQVSLQRREGDQWFHFCGGSVFNEVTIITTAHCFT